VQKESDHYGLRRDSTPHPCNDPSLSATEFLYAVYRDRTFPMSVRIKAATALLPYTNSLPHSAGAAERPTDIPPRCKIVIGGLGPCDHGPASIPPGGSTENDSQNPEFAHKAPTHNLDPPGSLNIEEIPPPLSFNEIQEIKAAIQRLHPDADLSHLPDHLQLCECGHWMPFPCKCVKLHGR
jgi:hypothetical protein